MKITLDEYVYQLQAEISAFRNHWRVGQKQEGKKRWPDKMSSGDWDEQLQAHLSTVRSVDKAYEESQ